MRRPFAPARRRAILLAAAALVPALAFAACGGSDGPSLAPSASAAGSPVVAAPSGVVALPTDASVLAPAEVTSPAVGVVVAIESSGLEDVSGFTLRTDGGVVATFRIAGPLENATAFPLGHLGEHVATADPVRVWFRRSGGALIVYKIEDAS